MIKFRLVVCNAVTLMLLSGTGFGQTSSHTNKWNAAVEAGGFAASDPATPFWLRTNQFGIVPHRSPAGMVQASFYKNYVFRDSLTGRLKKWDWGVAVNPVATYEKDNEFKFLLPEASAKVRFRRLEFYAGRRRELMGIGDSLLSSGFYSGSGNAMPIPKVQLSTIGYIPLRFTKDFVAVSAGFSHGWFNSPYMQGVRLHQKYAYIRLGKPTSGSKFYFGLNHNVLWAGRSEFLKQHPELAIDGELPSSWKFYPNVVLAYTSKNWYTKNGYSSFDSYRLGNHLGSYDFAFETKISNYRLLAYHQHAFEDVSSMVFKNIPDGLYGVSFKLNAERTGTTGFLLSHITLEFLTTKDQSGSEFYVPGSKFQGADNYFNHSQYYEGWSYFGQTVGTPFIAPGKDMDRSKGITGRYFPNNRVNMLYLGAQGRYGKSLLLTFRTSYSRNFGVPGFAFNPPRGQFSSFLSAQYALGQSTSIIARLAVDQGDLFVKSTGGYLGVRKSF